MPTRTELIWDGKYDATGQRVASLDIALPFQTIETVNESAQDRDRNLFQFAARDQPILSPWPQFVVNSRSSAPSRE